MFKGRSSEAKKKSISKIVKNLELQPGILGNDILIVILEPPLENWGTRGGKTPSEVDLGFKINI